MAFLDNSRDIILDAVLTDLGRKRLAQGDGSFRITKFALGDDEINYALYDKNNQSGSAYYDLDLLQTPVFEAFTNNISTMNSRLVTLASNNNLYLPVLKLNEKGTNLQSARSAPNATAIQCGFARSTLTAFSNLFVVAVNDATYQSLTGSLNGVINGVNKDQTTYIRVDQGIDSTDISATKDLASISTDLIEQRYTLEIDNRFGLISFGQTQVEPSFIDDDDVALYSFSLGDTTVQNVSRLSNQTNNPENDNSGVDRYAVSGPRGTAIHFGVFATDLLQDTSNSYYFDTYGTTESVGGVTYKVIHTTITITGELTGYSLDIPVVFVRV